MVLVQYLRRKRSGRSVKAGVMLAKEVSQKDKNGKVLVGWSKCKLAVDKFDPKLGVDIAEKRIQARLDKERDKKRKVPDSMAEDLETFVERCKRYFKTKNVKVV